MKVMDNIREKLKGLLMKAYDEWYGEESSATDGWDYFADHLISNGVTVHEQKEMICTTTMNGFRNMEDAQKAGYYRRHYFCPICNIEIGHRTFDTKRMFGQGTLLKGDEFPKHCPECGTRIVFPAAPKGE